MLFYEGVEEDEIRRNCDALPNVEWMLLLTWGKWSPLSLEAFWQTPCGPLGVDRPLPLPVGWAPNGMCAAASCSAFGAQNSC